MKIGVSAFLRAAGGASVLVVSTVALLEMNFLLAAEPIARGIAPSGMPEIVMNVQPKIDGAILPSTLIVGGIGNYDTVPFKVTGQLVGHGDWGGCLLNVQEAVSEQYARCGAGADEEIVAMFKTSTQKPLIEFGQDIKTEPGGIVHTVSLSGTTVTIVPALTATELLRIYPRSRIYSNYYQGMSNSHANGQADIPAVWYGYIGNMSTTRVATTISVWSDPDNFTPGWINNMGRSSRMSPGSNPDDAIDTYLSSYRHASVFIGAGSRKFINNEMIQLDPSVRDSMTRSAAGGELDLQMIDNEGYHKHDGMFSVQGKTIVMTGKDFPSDDSYGMRIAGSNLLPQALILDGVRYGGQVIHTDAGYQLYKQNDLAFSPTNGSLLYEQLGAYNFGGWISSLMLYGNKDRTSADHSWADASIHLGMVETNDSGVANGNSPDCRNCSGGGQIVWHPPGYHFGIGLGVGLAGKVDYGVIVDSRGATTLPNGASTYGALSFHEGGGSIGRIGADGFGNLSIKSSKVIYSDRSGTVIYTGRAQFIGKMIIPFGTPHSSSAACIPGEMKMDKDYLYSCVTQNTWHRVSTGQSW